MNTLLEHPMVRRIGATVGVVGSVALAFFYVLVPVLTVPAPAKYGFYLTWVVLVVLSLNWWRRHTWGSLAVPIVGLVAVLAVLWFGGAYLGWAP